MSEIRGRLVLESLTDDEAKKQVAGFLNHHAKNVDENRIMQMLSSLPVVLIKNTTEEQGQGIAEKLTKIGARTRFIPFRRPAPPPDASHRNASASPSVRQAVLSSKAGGRSTLHKLLPFIILLCAGIGGYTLFAEQLMLPSFFRGPVSSYHFPYDDEDTGGDTYEINGAEYLIVDENEKWINALYADRDFEAVTRHARWLLEDRKDPIRMYALYIFYYALGKIRDDASDEAIRDMEAVLDQWCRADPESHISWLVRGRFYIELGWHFRGGSYASEVAEDAWPKFHSALKRARQDLEKSYALSSDDPNAPCYLIAVAKGLSLPRKEMEEYFNHAVSASPFHFGAHHQKLEYLKPKWHGSPREMSDFVKKCSGAAFRNPLLGFLPVAALEEAHRQNKDANVLGQSQVWPAVKKTYESYLTRYPGDLRRRFFYAYHAYLAGKYDIARQQFDLIGDRWINDTCWSGFEYYNRTRAKLYYLAGADLLWKKKRHAESADYFLLAIRYNPTANACYGLGISYWHTGYRKRQVSLLKEAEKMLEAALELDPEHEQAKDQLMKLRRNLAAAERRLRQRE